MKVVFILSIFVAVCYTQTPTRPVIPETFQSEVSSCSSCKINMACKQLQLVMYILQLMHRYSQYDVLYIVHCRWMQCFMNMKCTRAKVSSYATCQPRDHNVMALQQSQQQQTLNYTHARVDIATAIVYSYIASSYCIELTISQQSLNSSGLCTCVSVQVIS